MPSSRPTRSKQRSKELPDNSKSKFTLQSFVRAFPSAPELTYFQPGLLAALDNQGQPVYLIYSMPVLSACGAVWVYATWQRSDYLRYVPVLLLTASILATVGGFCVKIAENNYRNV